MPWQISLITIVIYYSINYCRFVMVSFHSYSENQALQGPIRYHLRWRGRSVVVVKLLVNVRYGEYSLVKFTSVCLSVFICLS